jgi:thiol-disulfide isomerase/thioredoxin
MNIQSFRALLACAALGLSYMVPQMPGSADDGSILMPDIQLADGSGLPFPLSRYRGAVLVLEFWSTNCGPCLRDLTFLDRLQGDMKGKPFLALAVSEDDMTMAKIKATLARQKLNFLRPFADPGGNAAQTLNLRGLPTSFVIDRQGRVVMQLEGVQQWDRADYEKRILFLLAQSYP